MAACTLEFKDGGTGIYQMLASKSEAASMLASTRRDVYFQ